jgi:histidyl-tRNA synthetase
VVGVPFHEDPHLVRGLDYYTRTVFEIYHGDTGAQSALCGGGRYDSLVAECGGPDTPAMGFSAGLERIIHALPSAPDAAVDGDTVIRYYVACLGAESESRALAVARALRALGSTEVDFSGRSRKTQLESAAKKRARFAIVVDAVDPDQVVWHDVSSRAESRVPDARVAAFAHERGVTK